MELYLDANGVPGVKVAESDPVRVYAQDTYDNEPAPGHKQNDMKIITSLAYKF